MGIMWPEGGTHLYSATISALTLAIVIRASGWGWSATYQYS